ncbi:MAG: DUF2065 domain-containing protein [Fimbriimonadaceae bacterium]|nr:DUF2065 domain-containing protein [Alphaproteobacteria bacterium]
MSDFFAALGLVLVIEGLVYAAFPGAVIKMLETIKEWNPSALRMGGVMAIAVGVFVVWLARS